ncbi:MAG TPA: nitrilase-related carbon-nitrogen hydrolase, partial [Terriglobales bacterium]|nr:nitrilase-related carbon-nitrogen hydrolase [Terriglobales bacterium]
ALVFAACVLLARAAARARTSLEAVLVLPLAWTGFEWILASFSPHGTFGSLAYSQMNFLPALQMAALVGHVGITFLVALASSGLAFAWHLRRQPRRAAATLGTAALVVGLSLGWGAARLRDRAPGPALRVGLAAADSTIRWFRTLAPDTTLAIVRGCTERIDRLAASGARLVVLPEKIVGVPDAAADSALALLRRAAERNRITIVAGFNRRSARFARNIAWVVSRGGVATYDKAHPVPGFEDDYEIGREPLVLADRTPRLGVAICKDMDFPDWTLRYARRGVDVLAVPAWDFGEDGWLHSRMAILRGVEGGFSVARCAQDGRLTLSDPFGHVTAEQASSDAPEVLVTGSVPAIGIVTPLREGWGLGWVLGLAGLFVACPLRLPRGSRAAAASGESRPPAIASPEIEEEL